MAEVKITALPAYADPASTDVLPIVDVAADLTKKVSIADLLENAATGSASSPSFAFDGDSNTGMYRSGADALAFSTGGTGRLFIDSSGNVKIGSPSTAAVFNVQGAAGLGIDIAGRSSDGGAQLRLMNNAGTTSNTAIFGGDTYGGISSATYLEFQTAGSPRMRIDSSGRVGIGTSLPSAMLHVNGAAASTSPHLRISADRGLIARLGDTSGSAQSLFDLYDTDGTTQIVKFISGSGADFINTGGNLGIGTTTPSTSLHVSGGDITANQNLLIRGTDSNGVFIRNGANTSWGCQLQGNGNAHFLGSVGIGTTSPDNALHVNGNISFGNRDASGTRSIGYSSNGSFGGNSPHISFAGNGTGSDIIYRCWAGNHIWQDFDANERARIDSSGRLLVGTSSSKSAGAGQYAPLNVQGYIGSSAGGGEICLSRGEAASSITANDQLGAIVFADSAGYGFASINCKADESAGSSDYPGRLEFKTAADGSGSMTERMRIDSSGNLIQYSTGTLERQHRQQASSSYTATNIRSVIDGAAGYLAFDTGTNWTNGNATERMRIDRSGRVLIGVTADTGSQPDRRETLQLTHNNGARMVLGRSNSTVGDTNTIGIVNFRSKGGGTYHDSAQILVSADGAHSATDKASDMIFKTTKNNETATSEALRIRSNGRLELPAGSQGIWFDGNTGEGLNAYEEGTFTVTIADATSGGNEASTSNRAGRYTRIGNLVTILVFAQNINTTGMTGGNDIIIRGFPFQAVNTSSTLFWTGSLLIDGGFDLTASEFQPLVTIADNHSYARIMIPDNTGNRTNANVEDITSGATDLRFSLTYEVAD